jgi:hypothetical protein
MTHIPKISPELAERTKSFNEDLIRSIDPAESPVLHEYRRRLQAIHPRLTMVRARERIVPGVPMKPGYYHVLVYSETAPWSVAVVEGELGQFVEPTSRVIEKVIAGDMTEQRNLERFARAQNDEHAANAREQQRVNEERRGHVKDLVNAYSRTSVSMNDDTPWTQNAQPNSLRAREEAKKKR